MNNDEKIVVKLLKCGFSITEAWTLLRSVGLVKPWVIIEEKGLSVVNNYSLDKIKVI